ncbi:MAG TPA: DNA adenine methylase [Sedimentisphaerales bacterium]|nr:DNA adenine methylase [Sedimentisphaerales bacterium]
MVQTLIGAKAKPFLKWAGGKTQLLDQIDKRLPKEDFANGRIDTYVEPFLGGGAVFFHIAQRYASFRRFYLSDINEDLVRSFEAVKENVEAVIAELEVLQGAFYRKRTGETRRQLYLDVRREFNLEKGSHFGFATAAKLVFLNKTCYNGLFRVNQRGLFNVPFGDYKKPTICNAQNLRAAAEVLRKAQVGCAGFQQSGRYVSNRSFVYLDPPYRPISRTAGFTSYSREDFNEKEQVKLAAFCRDVEQSGAKFLLSNSDPKNQDPNDNFFEEKYKGFRIERVKASRAINCKGGRRGQINELIIRNY